MNQISKRETGFTQVNNDILNSTLISLKAKGLYAYMFSKPNGWNFTIRSIATQLKEGKDSIRTAMSELKDSGVIEYKKYSNGEGEYTLNSTIQNKPKSENPNLGNPNVGKSERISNKDTTSNKDTYSEIAPKIVAHLNELTHKKYSSTAKETERLIKARVKDGYSLNDFIIVIDNKVSQWIFDDKMSKYLRPETLFGNKFDKYLNETKVDSNSPANNFG